LAVTFFGIAAEFCFLDIRENGWFFFLACSWLLLKAFRLRRVTYFINACGIDPPGRQSRSNAKAFVLRQNK
jgi:hypothetical protein